MKTIVLYSFPTSAPARAVKMTAELLNIKLEVIDVDLRKKEQFKPEFLKLNHCHLVPVINDDGFILAESRAIMGYLINQYYPDHPLYPEDPQQRAVIDKMLHFDVTHYSRLFDWLYPVLFMGLPEDPEHRRAYEEDCLKVFEEIFSKTPYAVGDHMTLADISILSVVGFLEVVSFPVENYPHVHAWFTKMRSEIPNYKVISDKPLMALKEQYESKK